MSGISESEPIGALSLLSGGLDSQLAVCVLRDQGIDVHAVVFESPFFDAVNGKRAAANLGIPVHVIDFTRNIVELLKDPPHGFGSCMNPCVDCHAAMLRRAGQLMEELHFQFLSTGEVLAQRPKSQNRHALGIVARASGYDDYIVRPLSAKCLPETLPERRGWVDRERLLGLSGRSRKPQLELAKHYRLEEFPTPAGGCRLTEPNFCKRLRDLVDHEGLSGRRALTLLRVGRHFRLEDQVKLVVGRNERDNAILEGTAELYDLILKVEGIPGPTGLLPFTAREDQIRRAAAICARYCDAEPGQTVTVRVVSPRERRRIDVSAADPADIAPLMV